MNKKNTRGPSMYGSHKETVKGIYTTKSVNWLGLTIRLTVMQITTISIALSQREEGRYLEVQRECIHFNMNSNYIKKVNISKG